MSCFRYYDHRLRNIRMFYFILLSLLLLPYLFYTPRTVQASPASRIIVYGRGCYSCFLNYVDELKVALHSLGVVNIELRNLDEDNYALSDLNLLYQVLSVPEDLRGNLVVSVDDKYLFMDYVPVDVVEDFLKNHEHEYSVLVVRWDESEGLFKLMDEGGGVRECWIEDSVSECVEGSRASPTPKLLSLVLVSGLIDGVNPCAFAVMFFFIAVLFMARSSASYREVRKRILLVGVVYIAAVFLAYVAIGLTLIKVFKLLPFPHLIARLGSITLILLGIINVKDYFWPGLGFSLGIPTSRWESVRRWMHKFTLPATFAVGLMVGFFEFPCTGGIYIAILGLLADKTSFMEGLGYLLLYNLMFVIPLAAILVFSTNRRMYRFSIERWRKGESRVMRLESGLLMIILGIILLIVA